MDEKSEDCACVTHRGRFVNVCELHRDDEGRKWRMRAMDANAEIERLRARIDDARQPNGSLDLAGALVKRDAEIARLQAALDRAKRWMPKDSREAYERNERALRGEGE